MKGKEEYNYVQFCGARFILEENTLYPVSLRKTKTGDVVAKNPHWFAKLWGDKLINRNHIVIGKKEDVKEL